MFTDIETSDELEVLINSETALLVYFSTNNCNVCKSLKPKVGQTVLNNFEKMKMAYVRTDVLPEAAGKHHVFTAPTVLVFFEGKETVRKIRNFGIEELIHEISRPYSLVFSE